MRFLKSYAGKNSNISERNDKSLKNKNPATNRYGILSKKYS